MAWLSLRPSMVAAALSISLSELVYSITLAQAVFCLSKTDPSGSMRSLLFHHAIRFSGTLLPALFRRLLFRPLLPD
jgi:hypothetical protein